MSVLMRENRDNYWMLNWLDKFMEGHKGFICGGCFKNIFNQEKVKDLDIFFQNEGDREEAVDYFDSMTAGYTDGKMEDTILMQRLNVHIAMIRLTLMKLWIKRLQHFILRYL